MSSLLPAEQDLPEVQAVLVVVALSSSRSAAMSSDS